MPGAVRIGDMRICKEKEGNIPHVGGPVGPSPTVSSVTINGLPAAVVGDSAVCVGRPDKIVTGIASIEIEGKPVADSSASTEHGSRFATCSGDVEFG